MKLDWLDDGSLMILLPEPLLSAWHGVDSNDYDRAGAGSNAWLNAIPIEGSHGFVLGGDPGMVLVALDAHGAALLIRWVYAEDEEELVEFALQGKSVTKSEPDLVFNNTFAKWWLFNAAANPSSDRPAMRAVDLPFGQIRVETVYCENKTNAAIVHRFREST